ncbi:1-phosphatidylinositol 4,5-bisphosphate phosphodiesterase gamma-1 isoform X1 [Bombyx mandarina]|uniref:1-phosphatidylinositol 4,5-bisphosphate phosphodiesterase gamma n=1 Tax=Bombyx mandarina TaxID=7092 RepID=A0A6J2KCA1_BOMMA|nr:1-phosphatidylinositol 4,5-bisphosphate phosphodiesterase gamma-1 isoform X1 [Bombyx mandarina]XP_028039566.1 1-phosphatidylinositol 4,5-bisphosphate phosphodiesterase gamma-1 isoform X1 [Bombyx mandarina]
MKSVCFNGAKDRLIHEADQLISYIERGSTVLKFFPRKRPERRALCVRRETHQVLWSRINAPQRQGYEGALDIRDVKEVRTGKSSKDFERWPEETKRLESSKCFTIYYGTEFKLRCASFVAQTDKECEAWVKGVLYLIAEAVSASYPLQIERWLRKEFYSIENSHEKITLKEVKAFLPKINCKISTSKLRDVFQDVDTEKRGEIGFDDFAVLYQKLIFDENNVQDIFDKYSVYCSNGTTITLREFQNFLRDEQHDNLGDDEVQASQFIRDYLRDPQRDIYEPYFTLSEFVEMLYSKQNSIYDSQYDKVTQDMTRPLSHYWISSSHNTYLTGDQFSSESSLEAYVRCLRSGCRCIELDCWDGPDGTPFIYHGHTLTTKIRFMDVLRTIKEHAFITSEYPLILSIEDNCSLPQQRRMASAFQDVFGDLLLVHPMDKNETSLPSPHDLRRKIILKHKKLPEGAEESSFAVRQEEGKDLDLRNSIKNGILHLEDPVDKEWKPHAFVLTENKLYYTESYNSQEETDTESDGDSDAENAIVPQDELHFAECWFHGKLAGNRQEAEDLLRAHAHLGDGTFLVRESVTFVGDYCLSFWRQGKVNHCRIKLKQERGVTKFYLIDSMCFDSLYNLITHYRSHPLRSQEFLITLKEPVPQPNKHEGKEWFHAHCTRTQAEELLRKTNTDGAFLVRPSEKEQGSFAISFRTEKEIKHCRVKQEGRLYTIGTVKFESLIELVSYYENHPLYKKVKLWYPISEETVRRLVSEPDDNTVYGTPGYMDPTSFTSKVTVKALYDYRARQDDELSFCKHAIITNVDKPDEGWWRGDYGGKRHHWFPANYVLEIEVPHTPDVTSGLENESAALGSLQKGVLDVLGAIVELVVGDGGGAARWLVRVQSPAMYSPFDMAAATRESALEWLSAIEEAAHSASARSLHHRKMERTWRIAKEISDLIIYCRSVTFNIERLRIKGFVYNEMSSFPETKAERLMSQQENTFFVKYHTTQLSRIYPKGQRIDSSNYNPVPFWNCGSQMVALNYQTPDKPMQVNMGKFKQNGGCGFILKPQFMFEEGYNPCDKKSIEGKVKPVTVMLRVIGARHLCKTGRGTASPFVEVEIIGADYDSGVKLVTKTVSDNGLNPLWNDICEFEVANPELALIRFVVQDEDIFGEPNFIGQATFPLLCLRKGYRSVPLTNAFSEELELSTLMVHLSIITDG